MSSGREENTLHFRDQDVTFRCAELEQIIGLRHEVLIVGTNRTSDEFAGDHEPTTHHFGAFIDNGRCIACASFMRQPIDDHPAWQLRGMATAPPWRNCGIGAALMDFALSELARTGDIRLVWANARTSAVDFYLHHGWQTITDPFMIPGVGMHYRIIRHIEADQVEPGSTG